MIVLLRSGILPLPERSSKSNYYGLSLSA